MDSSTASRFVSSLVQCIQTLCHGYVQFSSSIEIVGHIYLNVDKSSKFNYIVNEEVNKHPGNLTTIYHTNSYHSLPPVKQTLPVVSSNSSPVINLVTDGHVKNTASSAELISSSMNSINKTISVAYPVNIQNDKIGIDATTAHSQKRLPKESYSNKSPPALSSSKFFLKGKKRSKCAQEPEQDTSVLDPTFIIKQEPELSFPGNSCIVKNISDEKKHITVEESFMADEPCGDVTSKPSRDLYPVIHIKPDSTDLEHFSNNVANLPAGSESAVSETAGLHATKTLSPHIRHQIVEYANIVGNRPAARHFGVHESSIRHWRKKFLLMDLQGTGGKRGRKRKEDSSLDIRNDVLDASFKGEEINQT